MAKDTKQKKRLHLLCNPHGPDAVVVLVIGGIPGTIPVIPTKEATTYWALLSHPPSVS